MRLTSLTGAFVIVLGIVAGAAQELPRLVIEHPAATPLDAATLKQYVPTLDIPESDARNGFRVDLNGDGHVDVVRTYGPSMCGTGGCFIEIFDGRTRNSLGHLFGYPVWVFQTAINGWPTLGVYSHSSATSGSYSTFVFDGSRYIGVSSVSVRGESVEELFKRFRLTTKAR